MRKNTTKDQEKKTYRLRLNRETIRFLDNPDLLELAQGGKVWPTQNDPESTSQQSLLC